MNNYAFIDSQNLNLGIKSLGWHLDFKKFRKYLTDKYQVSKAYLFIGYITSNQPIYTMLQESGYILIFKPIILGEDKKPKGNVDADLVLRAMIDYQDYSKAIIVTSDGDFYCLVDYLYQNNKLSKVMSPYIKTCSVLLKKTAREKIVYMDNLQQKLQYKKAPLKD